MKIKNKSFNFINFEILLQTYLSSFLPNIKNKDAICAKEKKQLIISSLTTQKQLCCGSLFLLFLGSNGWYTPQKTMPFGADIDLLSGRRRKKLEKLLLWVYFGPFGKKKNSTAFENIEKKGLSYQVISSHVYF